MGSFLVAEFLLTSALRGPSAIAEFLVSVVLKLKKNKEINASKLYSQVGKFAERSKLQVL